MSDDWRKTVKVHSDPEYNWIMMKDQYKALELLKTRIRDVFDTRKIHHFLDADFYCDLNDGEIGFAFQFQGDEDEARRAVHVQMGVPFTTVKRSDQKSGVVLNWNVEGAHVVMQDGRIEVVINVY